MDSSATKYGYHMEKKNYDIYLTPAEPNQHKYTLIWMHGLGDSAKGFLDFFYAPNIVQPNVRFAV